MKITNIENGKIAVETPYNPEIENSGSNMKKIGAGLIGTIYLQDEGHVLKVIKKIPRDRWGRKVPRENAIANERRAIAYNESVPEKLRIFPETQEIEPGRFLKKRLFSIDLSTVSREERYRFGAALIHILKSGYGLVDGIQVMADEKGQLFICDADSFIDFSGLSEQARNHLAYQVNTFISRELGIGEWITLYCTVEKTITAFEKEEKKE